MTEDAEVERVARAISDSNAPKMGDWERQPEGWQNRCRNQARAAIAALRAGDEKPDFKALADETYEKWLRSEFGHGGIREAIEAGIRAGAASPRYGWNEAIEAAAKEADKIACNVVATPAGQHDDYQIGWQDGAMEASAAIALLKHPTPATERQDGGDEFKP